MHNPPLAYYLCHLFALVPNLKSSWFDMQYVLRRHLVLYTKVFLAIYEERHENRPVNRHVNRHEDVLEDRHDVPHELHHEQR